MDHRSRDFCVIGVDLGGTNVRAKAVWPDGTIAGDPNLRLEFPSNAQQGTGAIIDSLASAILAAKEDAQGPVKAVGLAVPGIVDDRLGIVRWAPNFGETRDGVFYSWKDIEVRSLLEPKVGLPIHMGNDANLAALGEYEFGSGRSQARCLVMLTLGTGVGGGVVMSPYSVLGDARGPLVLLGGNQGGAELGHMNILNGGLECAAGSYGALEAYCQRDSIIRRALIKIQRGHASKIPDLAGGDLSAITPKMISDAAMQGDEVAIEVWEEVGGYLGVGIGNYINIFAPDIFAIGGQIAKAGKPLMDAAIKSARNVAVPFLFGDCSIVQAEQIDDAGLLGGAALALESMAWSATS